MMEKRYDNMYALLNGEQEAWNYFHSLPEAARSQISEREGQVHTYARLRLYGDSITKRG